MFCVDVKTAFNELKKDKTRFFVLKPAKAHDTAQKAMAAFLYEYKYEVCLSWESVALWYSTYIGTLYTRKVRW